MTQYANCRLPGFIGPVPPPLWIRVFVTMQLSRELLWSIPACSFAVNTCKLRSALLFCVI
jgi:hypothetical protein